MAKSINQRFIDYMNEPAKPMTGTTFAWWAFFIYTAAWTFYGYIAGLCIVAVVILPIQLIKGVWTWMFG